MNKFWNWHINLIRKYPVWCAYVAWLEGIEEQQLGMAYKTSKSFGGEKNRSKGRYFSTLKGANRNE